MIRPLTPLFAAKRGESSKSSEPPNSDGSSATLAESAAPAASNAPLDNIESIEEFESLGTKDLQVQTDQEQKKIDTLSPETVNEIVRQYASKTETTPGLAVIGIAALSQAGGTNAGNPSLKRTINKITFDLQTLREVVKYVTSNKGTVRQLAKSMRDVIAKISMANDWPGPLANALVKEFPDMKFDSNDLVYAAEYHDDNRNPEFPEVVAKALAIRETRGREARRTMVKSTSKGKKKNKNKKGK